VRAQTVEGGSENEYMCRETGVGSGSVYREGRLFATQEEAQVAADELAALSNAGEVPWVKKQYDETLEVCEYQLRDARSEEARKEKSALQWKVHDLLNSIEAAESVAEVVALVEEFRQ
jgi:hypothetical protein